MRRVRPILVVCGLALWGCGKQSGLEKVVVQGKVTYAGQAIENGQIYFYPLPGTKGPVSGAPIKDGVYRAEAKGGVPVGRHRVKVEGFRPAQAGSDGDLLSVSPAGQRPTSGAPLQYIPVKYNRDSQLEVEIPSGQDEFSHDFELLK